jgi:hypothetical protein
MDQLPSELVSIIVAELVHEDIVKKPTAWLVRKNLFESREFDDWLSYSNDARADLCNFRLVNRKSYYSSFATFGNILGHRVFRITQVGLEDLQAISNTPRLRLHIRTLTFGTARFANPARISVLQRVLEDVPEPDRTRLRAAHSEAYRWQQAHRGSRYTKEVAPLLERLPQLRSLRIFLPDLPTAENHLGGWLGPSDTEILLKAHVRPHASPPPPLISADIYHAFDKDLTALNPLFNALMPSKTVIQDLRIGPWIAVLPHDFSRILQNTGMMSSLTHLRFDVSPDHLQERDSFTSHSYREVFEQITSVTHLTLAMEEIPGFERYVEATNNLLGLLSLLHQPQHLTIRGVWEYSENQLFDLISTHQESLKLLSLKEAVMVSGNWTSTVQRLVQLPLRHLEVSDMRAWVSSRSEVSTVDDDTWRKFVSSAKKDVEDQRTCEVYLSSGGKEYLFRPGTK